MCYLTVLREDFPRLTYIVPSANSRRHPTAFRKALTVTIFCYGNVYAKSRLDYRLLFYDVCLTKNKDLLLGLIFDFVVCICVMSILIKACRKSFVH